MTMLVEIDLTTTLAVPEEYSGNVLEWIENTLDYKDLIALLSNAYFFERECDHARYSYTEDAPEIIRNPDNPVSITIRRKARCDDCGCLLSCNEICKRLVYTETPIDDGSE